MYKENKVSFPICLLNYEKNYIIDNLLYFVADNLLHKVKQYILVGITNSNELSDYSKIISSADMRYRRQLLMNKCVSSNKKIRNSISINDLYMITKYTDNKIK
jgi:hypothetical protein